MPIHLGQNKLNISILFYFVSPPDIGIKIKSTTMAGWCSVTISFAGTGYRQNYKRYLNVHSHAKEGEFVMAAKNDSLAPINAGRPRNIANPVLLNHIAQAFLRVEMGADPGNTYRLI